MAVGTALTVKLRARKSPLPELRSRGLRRSTARSGAVLTVVVRVEEIEGATVGADTMLARAGSKVGPEAQGRRTEKKENRTAVS